MYTPTSNRLGIQPIAVANVPNATLQSGQSPFANQEMGLGEIIPAVDPVYGGGEFIYLQMVTGQVVGSWVTYTGYGTVGSGTANQGQYQATLMPTTANTDRPVAVAMSAFPSGSPATAYGWFQIAGLAVAADNGTLASPPTPVYAVGSGQVTSVQANGKQIQNASSVVADGTPAAGLCLCAINRPYVQGQVV